MLCNHVSRYDVAAAAVRAGASHNPKVAIEAHQMSSYIMHLAALDKQYIYREGRGKFMTECILPSCGLTVQHLDPDGTFDTPVFEAVQP